MFNGLEFIEKKRNNGHHSDDEMRALVAAVTSGEMPNYQLSSWLMATYFNGLDDDEIVALTKALGESGSVIKYPPNLHIVDKHSTGGVGDKVTLILVPLVAACGGHISKLSGPGLGFTGGTVDKLEAIPGMNVHLTMEQFYEQIEKIGCAISGHSVQLAPAEGEFYTLRDVTGTVPSLSLITTSILSKKLAGGADGYVFDVKCGNGALMEDLNEAKRLAEKLVGTSKKLGKKSVALITDMEQPLGIWIGNAVEVFEALEVLSGSGPEDTRELCITLGGQMLAMAQVAATPEKGMEMCAEALGNWSALRKFEELVKAQGGSVEIFTAPQKYLLTARHVHDIKCGSDGYVSKLAARQIGEGLRALGGGRLKQDDVIDHAVGVELCAKIGDRIEKGDTVMKIHYNEEKQLSFALGYFERSWEVTPHAEKRNLILAKVE